MSNGGRYMVVMVVCIYTQSSILTYTDIPRYKIMQTHTLILCCSQMTCYLPSCLSTMLSSKGIQIDISFLLSRYRGRSPEEGRKSRRAHSRRCSKNHYKVSPEARSSHLPSQPLQRLGFLSARGVVSILTSPLSALP